MGTTVKFNTKYIIVQKNNEGEKLFQFIMRQLDNKIPKSAVMKWIRTGQIRVDGKRSKPFSRLKKGQKIRIPPYFLDEKLIKEKSTNPFDLKKVYEDEDLIVLVKPPNLCVQPGKNVEDSVYHRLKSTYGTNFYLVHRLDKETSGLLLIAKSYSYLQHLQKLWLENKMRKIYLAWVNSPTNWWKWKKLEDILIINKKKYYASCYAKTLRNNNNSSLLVILLNTGRKHQIRIQLANRNRPIIGDKKYGGKGSNQGLLLHAYLLSWENISFSYPPMWKAPYNITEKDILNIPCENLEHLLT